jgi:hypothetical protein
MKWLRLATLLLVGMACLSQENVPPKPYEKAVQWVDINVPTYPPLAHQARILGTFTIEVRFKGCELAPDSPRIVSGHRMLTDAALESLRLSTLRCGDFPDSTATVYYEFADYDRPSCEDGPPRVEVTGSHVRIMRTIPCWNP